VDGVVYGRERNYRLFKLMITVEDILKLPEFREAKVVAGAKGTGRCVRYVDICEVPDAHLWLASDVFTMTTGYAFCQDPRALVHFMQSLVGNAMAGVGFKLGRFLKELPQEFYDIANRYDLPVVFLPMNLDYRHAIRAVTEIILEDERSGLVSDGLNNCFEQLLFGDSAAGPLENFTAAGLPPAASTVALIIDGSPVETYMLLTALKSFWEGQGSFLAAVEKPASTIVLTHAFPLRDRDFSRCARFAPDNVRVAAGGEHPLKEIRRSYEEALWTLRFSKSLKLPRSICAFSEVELFSLPLRSSGRKEKAKEAASRLLKPLIEYDARNDARLMETLRTFVLCDRDQKETALRLHLHRNSLRYRLAKIGRLLPENSLNGIGFHRLFLALLAYFYNE
jgi:hypothetical protein